MPLKRGDHVCSVYSTTAELAETAGRFLVEGLRRDERCWYVASGDEGHAVQQSLLAAGINVHREIARGALRIISSGGAYVIHGAFDPEATTRIFNDAIEQAYADGFTGFRAAAEMSWVLDHEDGPHQLIVYEVLLRTLFENARAIGLCLYDRQRMPLSVINGALATHPVCATHGGYRDNPFYDATTERLTTVDDAQVHARLQQLAQPASGAES